MKSREKLKELRGLSPEDLRKRIQEEREELMKIRFKHASAQLTETSKISELKGNIARGLTVLNQRRAV